MPIRTLYSVKTIKNLKDLVEQGVQLFADRNAFLVKDDAEKYKGITYLQLKQDMDALGTALLDIGLKDNYIAVVGENSYEWCLTYLSTVNGVGVIVPLDKELPQLEMENLLTRSAASALVYSGKLNDHVIKLANSVPSVKYLINMDIDEDSDGILSFKRLVEKGKRLIAQGSRVYSDAEIDSERMGILLFTSGTTDLAKGVMLSHKNICANIMSVRSTVYVDRNDATLSILPLHHTYECTLGFLTIIYSGGTIAFNEGLKHIAKNMKEARPTILILVPLILEGLYRKIWDQAGKRKGGRLKLKTALAVSGLLYKIFKIDLRKKLFRPIHENLGGRVRLIITGASGIEPAVSKGFRDMGILVLQGYGLTECSPLAVGNRDYEYRDDSVGLAIPGVEVKINDPDDKGIGEFLVKGDNVMLGYFRNREATKACLKDGWLYTGDLGYMDKDGFFYITGRSKNVIVTKNGKNIFPEEVESYINKSPFVQESLVWGRYDEETGETHVNAQIIPNFETIKEKLKLSLVSKEKLQEILNEVIKNANKNMPLYKRIRGFSIRESEFVKTTTKKIKRYMEKTGKQ